MNQIDTNIVETFKNVRAFCNKVALMLETTDGLMENAGWDSASGGTMFADSSAALTGSNAWIPDYMSRFYIHRNAPELLSFVGVLVGHRDKPNLVPMALATAGFLSYGDGKPGKSWEYRFARAHLFSKDRRDDGTYCVWNPTEWKNDMLGVKRGLTLAHPLSSIGDGPALERLLVTPLLKSLKEDASGQI